MRAIGIAVTVSPMTSSGVEVIAGVVRDPVMLGLGRAFVEILKDVTFRVAPFDADKARRMIREIRGFPFPEGARGARLRTWMP